MINKSYFRTEFSESIFNYKYKHENAETWEELSRTLIEDVCRDNLSREEKDELIEMHTDMEFIAGGRYLYYAGRMNKYFNNCFSGETKIITDKGLIPLKEIEGKTVNLLSPVTGDFLEAKIINHGKQLLRELIFKPLKGNSKIEYKIKSTRNHHWLLKDGTDTYDIRVGDIVPANTFSVKEDGVGFIHGLIFGDGSLEYINKKGENRFVNKIRLCGEKDISILDKVIKLLKNNNIDYSLSFPESYNGNPLLRIWFNYSFKELPNNETSASYKASFIKGWLLADGSEKSGNKLCSVNEEGIDWFIDNAALAGIVISGEKRNQIRDTQFAEQHNIFIINYSYGIDFQGFRLSSIKDLQEEEVFCPFEPIYNQIVIENGIHTFNCYLLKSLEDSRKDWADLSWKAISCLMTGGGIGNNYDIYRPKGSLIKRTGGKASGPISMMKILNENGREVMQGGSRRSAIYASLNWLHDDAGEFLHCKDWASMPVASAYDENGEQLTIADLKEKDFNYPAPLDMTNISLNYDNKFLEEIYGIPYNELLEIYKRGGKKAIFELSIVKIPLTFLENCRQALKTGEPGFSFNFFEKVFEILRNACTEVTSEDDSDVCNLASVNMSRIKTKERMERVVYLVGKFLLCGTLVAELPYKKVYEVREKNRRLGMGLMGVHEWLLQRGYRYEVVPELHEWLSIYKEYSETGANELADKLNINRPVAYRAIAPTGTIGIMAGTTTGIEPLFAVAYKRRYLKGQKEWHYQYVIDGTAKILIKEYGIDPYKIETALSLANDYERRIKFQADVQDYVDMSISSTINLPSWGTALNNDTRVNDFAHILAKYAVRLRGFTCYPDGSRGGQPLTIVDYNEAKKQEGEEFKEEFMDVCSLTGGGTCSS